MLSQIYLFKPVQMSVSTVFLLLIIYTVGIVWAKYLPQASWVEGTRFAGLAPTLHFINPGEFRIKEVGPLFIICVVVPRPDFSDSMQLRLLLRPRRPTVVARS